MAGDIVNGSFGDGLTGWRIVSGDAFRNQPVQAAGIGAQDVLIHGSPLVTLGGDYWHTNAFPLGQGGPALIRVVTEEDGDGVLDSVPFTITQQYLAYRLGGTAGGDAALEVRVPHNDLPPSRRALDKSDKEGYVAVLAVSPEGSDILSEDVIDLIGPDASQTLIGKTAKLRLRISQQHGPRRLLVSDLRQVDEKPPAVHRPLWGWADIHCHPMAQAGSGNLLAGHVHGPVEDIGSCLEVHGHDHGNPVHLLGMILDSHRTNDGSLPTTGWSTTTMPGPQEQGFTGWPAFDEVTHLKTHQDWIRRAYQGGLRLMVALVVHNELLTTLSTGLEFSQTDRDAIEPQVQLLHEFVAHNKDWCGLAAAPDEARRLIENNKMAFVLGLETDTINGWSKFSDFPTKEDDSTRAANRVAIHAKIHDYFQYLHNLGIVQVNLIHLIDNSFGGMALYDRRFVVNTFLRSGRLAEFTDGYLDDAGNPRGQGEAISLQVDWASWVGEAIESAAAQIGLTAPQLPFVAPYGHGHRNKVGLLPAGEEAVLEAMRFGMVIDMDHMSERATAQAYTLVTSRVPPPGPSYPLVAAHNGARWMAMTPPTQPPQAGTEPGPDERRNPETWPNESTKSNTQFGYIKETGGMFGHGIAGADSKQYVIPVTTVAGKIKYVVPVPHDAAGTSKTVAQGLQYVMEQLDMPVGLGTDWNILLGGPGPRFGPMPIPGLNGETGANDAWTDWFRNKRLEDATNQTHAVAYDTALRDWRSYRFKETGLHKGKGYELYGRFIWQALVLQDAKVDLTSKANVDALTESGSGPALDLALGLTTGDPGPMPSVYFQAGAKSRDPNFVLTSTSNDEITLINDLVQGITDIGALWERVKTPDSTAPALQRSTAGPLRDFDYNLDGLAHYGMLPDMLQDMKNVGLPAARFTAFFASAERYIQVWERCAALAPTMPHPPIPAPPQEASPDAQLVRAHAGRRSDDADAQGQAARRITAHPAAGGRPVHRSPRQPQLPGRRRARTGPVLPAPGLHGRRRQGRAHAGQLRALDVEGRR